MFNKGNERITKAFISALLEENIKKLKINDNKELYREYPNDKLRILDLQADVNNSETVDVEVQIVDRENLPERLIFYFSKIFNEKIKRGNMYEDAKKVILIAIIDYELDLTREIKEFETQMAAKRGEKTGKDIDR